eukprot:m.206897 g.206897  ORF g.206897 m.206897 type:complete len:553 (+) comp18909_c0_seq1:410-2068(+)
MPSSTRTKKMSSTPSELTFAQISTMNGPQLRDALKGAGLPTDGNRTQLESRLMNAAKPDGDNAEYRARSKEAQRLSDASRSQWYHPEWTYAQITEFLDSAHAGAFIIRRAPDCTTREGAENDMALAVQSGSKVCNVLLYAKNIEGAPWWNLKGTKIWFQDLLDLALYAHENPFHFPNVKGSAAEVRLDIASVKKAAAAHKIAEQKKAVQQKKKDKEEKAAIKKRSKSEMQDFLQRMEEKAKLKAEEDAKREADAMEELRIAREKEEKEAAAAAQQLAEEKRQEEAMAAKMKQDALEQAKMSGKQKTAARIAADAKLQAEEEERRRAAEDTKGFLSLADKKRALAAQKAKDDLVKQKQEEQQREQAERNERAQLLEQQEREHAEIERQKLEKIKLDAIEEQERNAKIQAAVAARAEADARAKQERREAAERQRKGQWETEAQRIKREKQEKQAAAQAKKDAELARKLKLKEELAADKLKRRSSTKTRVAHHENAVAPDAIPQLKVAPPSEKKTFEANKGIEVDVERHIGEIGSQASIASGPPPWAKRSLKSVK